MLLFSEIYGAWPMATPSSKYIIILAGLALGLMGSVDLASARDINLGGNRQDQVGSISRHAPTAELPKNVVALPTVVAPVQERETGRWKNVLVAAYLAPTDTATVAQMQLLKAQIARAVGKTLNTKPADQLQGARSGPRLAKECVHLAAEQTLGRSWPGDVYIRSLVVF